MKRKRKKPKQVKDMIRLVQQDSLPEHFKKISNQFNQRADELWTQTYLSEGARVFPNILRAISRQLTILSSSLSLPIEVAASVCRTVFEINIRVRLMTKQPELIKQFGIERVFEEISLLKSFKKLANADTNPNILLPIDKRIEELGNFIQKYQLKKPTYESVFQQAESAGYADEYKALYGFYSKYTHGSAWLVNSRDQERDGDDYRNIFTVQTQLYAYDSLGRIDEYVREVKGNAKPAVQH